MAGLAINSGRRAAKENIMRTKLLGGVGLAIIFSAVASAEVPDLETVRSEINQFDLDQTAEVDQTEAYGALSVIEQTGSTNEAIIVQKDGANGGGDAVLTSLIYQTGSDNYASVDQNT